jgi:hypothetical protein
MDRPCRRNGLKSGIGDDGEAAAALLVRDKWLITALQHAVAASITRSDQFATCP